jgi:hypothetical protein
LPPLYLTVWRFQAAYRELYSTSSEANFALLYEGAVVFSVQCWQLGVSQTEWTTKLTLLCTLVPTLLSCNVMECNAMQPTQTEEVHTN